MKHHLKKEFSEPEQMYIAIMVNRGKPIMHIAQSLHVCYYRVKREILKLKNHQNAKSNSIKY